MKQCHFCTNNINSVDYKKTETLRKFLTHHGRIVPKSETGICARHQRKLATAVKRARFMALLPYVIA